MKIQLFAAVLAAFVAPVDAGLFTRSNARVIVDSWARPDFIEARESEDGPRPIGYHMLKGKYFGGYVRDASLKRVTFEEVVGALATDMREQKFFPAPTPETGDMLIVVHWGVTSVEEDLSDLFPEEDSSEDSFGEEDEGGSFADTDTFSSAGQFDSVAARGDAENAKLLGFDRAFRRKGLTPSDEYELRSMLRDERYFIILMAYDWQKIRAEKKVELLWTTRFSMDSIGTNFDDAHLALSRAAAPYLASNLEDLTHSRTHLGKGDVKAGELEVIGEVSKETATGKPAKKAAKKE